MADVTIVPPAQIQTVASVGGQAPQGAQQASLPQGTLVSGAIVGKDANGNFLLKSPQGVFALQSSMPLTYNSDVTIRVGGNTAGNTSARIITVNGESFASFSTPEPETADSVSPTLLTQPAQSAAPPTAATALRAVVVSAPATQAPAATALAQGSAVTVRLVPSPAGQPQTQAAAPPESSPSVSGSATVAVQPQQTAQNPQPAIAPPPAASPQPATSAPAVAPAAAEPVETQLAPAQAVAQTPQTQPTPPETQPQQTVVLQQQAQPTPQPAPQQQELQQPAPQQPAQAAPSSPSASVSALYNVYARQSTAPTPVASPAPAAAPAASTASAAAPAGAQASALPAQIVSADENGTLTLQTALGNVTIKPAAPQDLSSFTPGAAVTVEIAAATENAPSSPAPAAELATSWQSLKDIADVVGNVNSSAANALLSRLPQIGENFTSASTAFITALVQNDARKLLGDDVVNVLRQQGRTDLVEKFSAEVANVSGSPASATQRQVAGWQMLFLPFVYQEELKQARIFVKRDAPKKEREPSKAAGDTRFVVEVDLSELGPMQMDGLVRKKEQTTAFDLVVRSHHAFAPADQQAIAGIYAEAAQLTGFKGSLAFQVTREFSVKPLEEAAGDEVHGITV